MPIYTSYVITFMYNICVIYIYIYIYIYTYITQQRDIYDKVIFRFLQIF